MQNLIKDRRFIFTTVLSLAIVTTLVALGGKTMRSNTQLALVSAVTDCSAGNCHYVRPGATGNGSGSDWTNAYPNLPATLLRGHIYFLADGNYGSQTFDDTTNGSAYITLKKATLSSHGTDTGWDSSYGDEQATFGNLTIKSSYWIFDGTARSSETSGYGFKSLSGDSSISVAANQNNLIFKYFELGDQDLNNFGYTADLNDGGINNVEFDYDYFHTQFGVFIYGSGNNGLIIDHSVFDTNNSTGPLHGEALQLRGVSNLVIRFSRFKNIKGSAFIASMSDGGSNWDIYSNIFDFSPEDSPILCQANSGTLTNVKFYGNSMYGAGNFCALAGSTGVDLKNNVYYHSSNLNFGGSITESYNYWSDALFPYAYVSSIGDTPVKAQNSPAGQYTTINTDPFVDRAGGDFHLKAALSGYDGVTLPAPYNVDYYGNVHGSDGVWDRGAVEFGISVTPSPTSMGNKTQAVDLLSSSGGVQSTYSTIQACVNAAIAGQTCLVWPGTYGEFVSFVRNGAAGNFIAVKAATRRQATVKRFNTAGYDYIHIEGFTIVGKQIPINSYGDYGEGVNATGSYLEIYDNFFNDVGGEGVVISGDHVTVKNNYMYMCQGGIYFDGVTDSLIEGNDIERIRKHNLNDTEDSDYLRAGGLNRVTIRHNYLHGVRNDPNEIGSGANMAHVDGFQFWPGAGQVFKNVVFEGNYFGSAHEGMMIQNGTLTDNNIVRNNVFLPAGPGELSPSWAICNEGTQLFVDNNVFASGAGIGFRGAAAGSIRNNIFVGLDYQPFWASDGGSYTASNNFLYNSGAGSPAGNNDILGNPLFINPSNLAGADGVLFTADDGYNLQSNSPAINKGISLSGAVDTDIVGTARPQGSFWDIGAYEYTGVIPTGTSVPTATPTPTATAIPTPTVTVIPTPTIISSTVTLGVNTVLESTDSNNSAYTVGYKVHNGVSGQVLSLNAYVTSASGSLRIGLYADNSGRPGTLIAESASINATNGLNSYTFSSPVAIVAGDYWLVYQSTSDGLLISRTTTGGTSAWYNPSAYGAFPNTWPGNTGQATDQYSIYATIKTSTESPTPTTIVTSTPTPTPTPDTAPATPTGLSVVSKTDTAINLAWNANTETDLGGYKIYVGGSLAGTVFKTFTTYQLTNLLPNTTYQIQLSAYDLASQESAKTAILSVTTNQPTDATSPSISILYPTKATTYSTTSSSFLLSGTSTDNISVTALTLTNNGQSITTTGTTNWSANLSLVQGTNSLVVTARDAVGNSSSKNLTVTYTYVDTVPPTLHINAPVFAKARSFFSRISSLFANVFLALNTTVPATSYTTTSSQASLSGTASDDTGISLITWISDRGGAGTAVGTNNWSIPSVALSAGVNNISVVVSDMAGNTTKGVVTITYNPPAPTLAPTAIMTPSPTASPRVTATPGGDLNPPAIPKGFKVGAVTPTSVALNWQANTEKDLKGYELYKNGKFVALINKPHTSYYVFQLSAHTTYDFQLTAVDMAGNESAKTAGLNITTASSSLPHRVSR